MSIDRRLILIELNEINFTLIEKYLHAGADLPGFDLLLQNKAVLTTSESSYQLLEPWIQWPSIHTGLPYEEHKIFRLGDAAHIPHTTIFEELEGDGLFVGAISPMNSANNLRAPAFFIPDPWTATQPDKHWASRLLTDVIRQAVNDNSSSKLTYRTVLSLCLCFFHFVPIRKYSYFIAKALQAIKKPWRKALFLDHLLWEIHNALLRKKTPHFSAIFLNAGAHIQHHYLLNSSHVGGGSTQNPDWYVPSDTDPVLEMLKSYSDMLLEIPDGYEFLLATGLSQVPFLAPEFYYRLRNHGEFLRLLGIEFLNVQPRMTRDFLVEFASEADATMAERQLSQVLIDGVDPMFGEIDNRGLSLFVVLNYPKEIVESTTVSLSGRVHKVLEYVNFVAIKNGAHNGKGYAFFSGGAEAFAPPDGAHVASLHASIKNFFADAADAAEYPPT